MITSTKLLSRVKYWQHKLAPLGIGHMRILEVSIVDDLALDDPDAVAGVTISEHYDSVKFEFVRSDLDGAEQSTLDECIVHEWVHVAMRDLDHTIDTATATDEADTAIERIINHEREKFVDRIARTIHARHVENC